MYTENRRLSNSHIQKKKGTQVHWKGKNVLLVAPAVLLFNNPTIGAYTYEVGELENLYYIFFNRGRQF